MRYNTRPMLSTPLRRWTAICWLVLGIWTAVVAVRTVTYDFRDGPVAGDQAGHALQALSLAYDSHTLNFDPTDLARWKALGWNPEPLGAFIQRYDGDRWALAKPYGYSAYAALFVAALGPVPGFAVANTVLLLALLALIVLVLRRAFHGPVVPLVAAAMVLASYTYMYTYVIHTELFLAVLTLAALGAAIRFHDTQRRRWALLAAVLMGFGIAEKAAFAGMFVPVLAVLIWRERRRGVRLAIPVAVALTFAVAVLPYLKYSGWTTVTPYGADRWYVATSTPFDGGGITPASFPATQTIGEKLIEDPGDKLQAAEYYLVGEHTGMLVFIPFALLALIAALVRLRSMDWLGRALLLGILAYIAQYVVLFPTNFYGGGQSLGNRYFLQMAPAVVALVAVARLPARLTGILAGTGIVLGLVFLWPHHLHPDVAYTRLPITSAPQRLLPFESNQDFKSAFVMPKP
jgi:hypothetical protein